MLQCVIEYLHKCKYQTLLRHRDVCRFFSSIKKRKRTHMYTHTENIFTVSMSLTAQKTNRFCVTLGLSEMKLLSGKGGRVKRTAESYETWLTGKGWLSYQMLSERQEIFLSC